MADVKTLYDLSGAFEPKVSAGNISCGIAIPGGAVTDDIGWLVGQIQRLTNVISGGVEVEGSLRVEIDYVNLSTNQLQTAKEATGWASQMNIPNLTTPYTWKRTRYTWNVDNNSTDIRTTYEITATALYPETLIMYIAVPASARESLQGPVDYGEEASDKNSEVTQKWHNYFPGISLSNVYGYMSVRHREAGENWPANGGWHTSLFAQYPVND